jgi:hypothetical protein
MARVGLVAAPTVAGSRSPASTASHADGRPATATIRVGRTRLPCEGWALALNMSDVALLLVCRPHAGTVVLNLPALLHPVRVPSLLCPVHALLLLLLLLAPDTTLMLLLATLRSNVLPAVLAAFDLVLVPTILPALDPVLVSTILTPLYTPLVPALMTNGPAMLVPVQPPVAGPVGAAVEKRPRVIVAVPVGIEHEAHHRHADDVEIVRQVHVLTVVEVVQVVRLHPPPGSAERHIAPRVIVEAAVNIEMRAVRDGGDDRISGARPRS